MPRCLAAVLLVSLAFIASGRCHGQEPKLRATLQGHSSSVYSVAFSLDGRLLVSGSNDETVKLWDVNTRKLRATFEGQTVKALAVAFSPDSSMVASGNADHTITSWEVSTGKLRALPTPFCSFLLSDPEN
jgi:WD40 repeat protein